MSQPSGPGEKLLGSVHNLIGALGDRAGSVLSDRVGSLTDRLTRIGDPGGTAKTALKKGTDALHAPQAAGHRVVGGLEDRAEELKHGAGQVRDKLRRDGGKKGRKLKVTNIVESIDVGVPVRIAYDQWTQFADFPSFTKKVEDVEQDAEEKVTWKAQVFWSHRTWESTILEQVPDERIVWRSTGDKGSVDGTVSFHELAEDLTRILVVLEYHPQGLVERTGNLWRAQGRRVRLELKHFVRHLMTETILDPDQLQGWRGEIREGRVVVDDETGRRREREQQQQCDGETEGKNDGQKGRPRGGNESG